MKVSSVPFKGTKDQEAKLLEVIAKYKGMKGALMPIMQEAQEIYGYLPYQVQKIISDETGIPIEKIYGVATFYAQFSMSPKGKCCIWLSKTLREGFRNVSTQENSRAMKA